MAAPDFVLAFYSSKHMLAMVNASMETENG
jgi:hypothetical protein